MQAARRLAQADALVVPAAVELDVPVQRAPGDQLVGQAGEQLFEDLAAPGQQPVGVAALRHAAALHARGWQQVPVDHGDAPVGVGQHPCRRQPGHAGPEHHGVVADGPRPDLRSCLHPCTSLVSGHRHQRRAAAAVVAGWRWSDSTVGVNQWPRSQPVLTCSTGPLVDPKVQRSTILAGARQAGSGQAMTSGMEGLLSSNSDVDARTVASQRVPTVFPSFPGRGSR